MWSYKAPDGLKLYCVSLGTLLITNTLFASLKKPRGLSKQNEKKGGGDKIVRKRIWSEIELTYGNRLSSVLWQEMSHVTEDLLQ